MVPEKKSKLSDDQLARLSQAVCSIYNKHFFRRCYVGLAFAGYRETGIPPPSPVKIRTQTILNVSRLAKENQHFTLAILTL